MPRHPAQQIRPIVTLMSDFGNRDFYVAAMKGVLIGLCPAVRLIDVTHEVPPQDILCGSITLERSIDGFPPGAFHLAVVDPGVGTDRRILIVQLKQQTIICPDNGLITWAWRRLGPGKVHELTWRPKTASRTFHGRDVMAPAIARLACGEAIRTISRPIDDPILLDIAPAQPAADRAVVIHLDHFGNATTNVALSALGAPDRTTVMVNRRRIGRIKRTYEDVAPGDPIALIGSSGLLEIAVRDGSAARDLKLRVGDPVRLKK